MGSVLGLPGVLEMCCTLTGVVVTRMNTFAETHEVYAENLCVLLYANRIYFLFFCKYYTVTAVVAGSRSHECISVFLVFVFFKPAVGAGKGDAKYQKLS